MKRCDEVRSLAFWYEACVRHALRNYSNPRALRRNPLAETRRIVALGETRSFTSWNPEVAALRHAIPELCIVGKTETENIGIDKIIKNTVTNPTIRTLILAGEDPQGHQPGKTLLALITNGVDERMRVIGSPGKRPVLRNVSRLEVEAFRTQVQVVDMIGTTDASAVARKVKEVEAVPEAPVNPLAARDVEALAAPMPQRIEAREPEAIELDRAGYFVIILQRQRQTVVIEHYSYENLLLHTIEGTTARSMYSTIIENGWVGQLSHAAYLGKELARAELALRPDGEYVQDGA